MLERYVNRELVEAGCDEAGRGCLAGSVFAAAVILPHDFFHPKLNDSKKLTERDREMLRPIIEREATAWCVATAAAEEIDEINILNASFLAMTRAVKGLEIVPEMLLIDGNRFRTELNIPYQCIIKGDGKVASIAAASILAKTHRDEYMMRLHAEYPYYGWDKNKGYPTKKHREAVAMHGLSPHNRLTFNTSNEEK